MSNWEEPLWVVNRIGNKLKEFMTGFREQIKSMFAPTENLVKGLHSNLIIPKDKPVNITSFNNNINISGKGYIISIGLCPTIGTSVTDIKLSVDGVTKIKFPEISTGYTGYGHYCYNSNRALVNHDMVIPFTQNAAISVGNAYGGAFGNALECYIVYVLTE